MKLERESEIRSSLKLVVGKEYTAANGKKIKILSESENSERYGFKTYWASCESLKVGHHVKEYRECGTPYPLSDGGYCIKQQQTHYINVYKSPNNDLFFYGIDGHLRYYNTREMADKYANNNRVACIKVVLEEGRFDD